MANVSRNRHAYLANQFRAALQGKESIFASKNYSAKKLAYLADQHDFAANGEKSIFDKPAAAPSVAKPAVEASAAPAEKAPKEKFVPAPFEVDVTFKEVESKNTEAAGDFLRTRVQCGESEVTGMIFQDALPGLKDVAVAGATVRVVAYQNRNKTLTIQGLAVAA